MHQLAQQFRQPTGFWGKVVGVALPILNRPANEWTLKLLDIQPTDHVLEAGFGPGLGIQKAATRASQGWIAGIDFSETMVEQAASRNAALIAAGHVELRYGDISSLPYHDEAFDKVFSVNVIYFWPEPLTALKELRRVMKPGARIALYLVAKEDMARALWTKTGVFASYSGEEVVRLLTDAGFRNARLATRTWLFWTGMYVMAEK